MNANSTSFELRIQQQLMMIEKNLIEARKKALTTSKIEARNQEIPTNSTKKTFKCEVCNKSFEHSGKLYRHIRIHTGEKPFECELCGKSFIQSGQLVIHMRSHTGQKPYQCNSCEKAFTCNKQLKVHIRSHTKEKPYKCNICGKSFGYNHVMKLHQVAHFGEKVYKCSLCCLNFDNKKLLEHHIRNHENEAKPLSNTPQRFLLPSINTILPDESQTQPMEDDCQPEDLSMKKRPRGNPLYPVTPDLIKQLMAEDLAKFGPPSPVLTPPLSPRIYGDCLVGGGRVVSHPHTLTPPPSVSPASSMASMSDRSLPLRKRRLAFSSESDSDLDRPSSVGSRSSVITFAMSPFMSCETV